MQNQKLCITLYQEDDETTVTLSDDLITWPEAHKAFFRMLRGAGYVINAKEYIEAVTDYVNGLAEAEQDVADEGVATELSVGGGGFLTEGDDDV